MQTKILGPRVYASSLSKPPFNHSQPVQLLIEFPTSISSKLNNPHTGRTSEEAPSAILTPRSLNKNSKLAIYLPVYVELACNLNLNIYKCKDVGYFNLRKKWVAWMDCLEQVWKWGTSQSQKMLGIQWHKMRCCLLFFSPLQHFLF